MPADRSDRGTAALLVAAVLVAASGETGVRAESAVWEAFGEVELEATAFARPPRFSAQDHHGISAAGQVSLLADWPGHGASLVLTPFIRIDSADSRRTHWDLREAKLEAHSGNWSFTLGSDTVFWGKTEFVRLVDIVNQVDRVENHSGHARLGQPMLRASNLGELGEFSVYYLPYFRERIYPGRAGRLRFDPPVETGLPIYDGSRERWTPSFAARFEGVLGDTDLGLSVFHGVGRDPAFRPVFPQLPSVPGTPAYFRPHYDRIFQAGIDVQHTVGGTLWKAEAILRNGQKNGRFEEEDYVALAGGLEHTLYGVIGSNLDLGMIAEYAWDSRGHWTLTGFQDDLLVGARIALNDASDTSLLLALAADMENDSSTLRLEAESRIANDVTLTVVGQTYWQFDSFEPGGGRTDDDMIRAHLRFYF